MKHHRRELSIEAIGTASFFLFAVLLSSCSLFGPDAPETIPAPPRPDSPANPGSGTQPPSNTDPSPAKKELITFEALDSVHILILDAQGGERQWQQLRTGERMPFVKQGSITITYSNGKALRILDSNGKILVPHLDKEGIAIQNLP